MLPKMFTFLFPVHPSVASWVSVLQFSNWFLSLPLSPASVSSSSLPQPSPALSYDSESARRNHTEGTSAGVCTVSPWIVLKCLSRENKANCLGDDRALWWILMAAQPVFCCPSQSARASQMYFLGRIYEVSDLYSLEGTLVTICFLCRLFGLPLSFLNGLSQHFPSLCSETSLRRVAVNIYLTFLGYIFNYVSVSWRCCGAGCYGFLRNCLAWCSFCFCFPFRPAAFLLSC